MTETISPQTASLVEPCDIFQNGSDDECGGPMFSDPQPELTLRVCAFHALMNRNYWMKQATEAASTITRLEQALRLMDSAIEVSRGGPFGGKDMNIRIHLSAYELATARDPYVLIDHSIDKAHAELREAARAALSQTPNPQTGSETDG